MPSPQRRWSFAWRLFWESLRGAVILGVTLSVATFARYGNRPYFGSGDALCFALAVLFTALIGGEVVWQAWQEWARREKSRHDNVVAELHDRYRRKLADHGVYLPAQHNGTLDRAG